MKILLAGGGSGGHVTPLKAIADALALQTKELDLTVITDRGFYKQTQMIFAEDNTIKLRKITSGKYRRYKSKSFFWHLYHLPTLLRNVRDVFLLSLGFLQSLRYLLFNRPDVVFCKGGFVCVPIGVVAGLLKIPIIIHDSDTRPGLTNRILARYAHAIATGMPTNFYPYPKELMTYTGIPVSAAFVKPTAKEVQGYKHALQLPTDEPLLLVTGGGNGSAPLNTLVSEVVPELLKRGWSVAHLVGKGKSEPVIKVRASLSKAQQSRWLIDEFAPMAVRLLAADVVIARTSASTLQECANAQKTVVGIPSPHLDDQKMNAEFFASKDAIIYCEEPVLEKDPKKLLKTLLDLQTKQPAAKLIAKNLNQNFAKPHAAEEIARLILQARASS